MTWEQLCIFLACLLLLPMAGTYLALVTFFAAQERRLSQLVPTKPQ